MSATIKTERLILRPWIEDDLEPFAQLNADPLVREYFPTLRNYQETTEDFQHIKEEFAAVGWGFWAATLIDSGQFIGFIGLHNVEFIENFTPAVEIGWRLAYEHWGKGYATEGATASLNYGFETLGLDKIVSFTAVQNERSQNVMKKIGMKHVPEKDFDHPKIVEGHPLRRHVLYQITQCEWTKTQI